MASEFTTATEIGSTFPNAKAKPITPTRMADEMDLPFDDEILLRILYDR